MKKLLLIKLLIGSTLLTTACVTFKTPVNIVDDRVAPQTGLVMAIDISDELMVSDCHFLLTSNDNKNFGLQLHLFSKLPQTIDLPEGQYNFEKITCERLHLGRTSIVIINSPLLKKVKVENNKLTVALPLKIEAMEDIVSIGVDYNGLSNYFKALYASFGTSKKLYSSYDGSLLPPAALKEGPLTNIRVQYLDTYQNQQKIVKLQNDILECKDKERNKHPILLGQKKLTYKNGLVSQDPKNKNIDSNYFETLDQCVKNALLDQGPSLNGPVTVLY